MTDPVLHDQTRRDLASCITRQNHAILLSAPAGAGKYFTACWLAAKLLETPLEKLEQHPFLLHVSPVGAAITIEQIRLVQRFLQLRTTGKRSLRRAVIIENAQTMTIEAQNALLKNLEEPPADTVFVLTATASSNLLPTIYSRVQQITIKPPSLDQIIVTGQPANNVQRIYALSGGYMGLFTALQTKDADHPLSASIETTKRLLRMTSYERLAQLEQLAPDKQAAEQLVTALKHIARAGLGHAAQSGNTAAIPRWHRVLQASHQAEERLYLTGNKKLVMTDLLLSL